MRSVKIRKTIRRLCRQHPWITAAAALGLLLTVGSLVFTMNPPAVSDPSKQVVVFHPVGYTLDLVLPWGESRAAQWMLNGWELFFAYTLRIMGWFLTIWVIAHTLHGVMDRPARQRGHDL